MPATPRKLTQRRRPELVAPGVGGKYLARARSRDPEADGEAARPPSSRAQRASATARPAQRRGGQLPHERARFAHNSERQFAKLLDFYGIAWEYEPRTFVLEWDSEGKPAQAFAPDFYLPSYDLYIEITTLNQKLVTKKNRKARRLRELYPEVRIKLFYQRDYLNLLVKYGLEEASAEMPVDESVEPLPLRFDEPDAPEERPAPRRRRKPGTLASFRDTSLVVTSKPDLSPVSDADRATEKLLRQRLAAERPDDGVLGEEFGETPGEGDGRRRWLLDPIDGTRNYIRGVPVWATLLALQEDGETVLGLVSAPALGRRWWATRGRGAYADGKPVKVSAVSDMADASLSYDSLVHFDELGLAGSFLALAKRCWRTRGFSDFWAHTLVAEGAVDVAAHAEIGAKLWDLAPLQVIVEEAGGRFTDLSGIRRADGGTAVSTNGNLHDEVLAALRPPA
ncbi:MAG: hypothetical protein LC799_09705 [Actinobacteria bacterium]|nr:hypothetical protein [Actinomycetota bacterium]